MQQTGRLPRSAVRKQAQRRPAAVAEAAEKAEEEAEEAVALRPPAEGHRQGGDPGAWQYLQAAGYRQQLQDEQEQRQWQRQEQQRQAQVGSIRMDRCRGRHMLLALS